ncbi:MAG: hypothetical protein AAB316_16815, partial [Bacteroidota bacterium]
ATGTEDVQHWRHEKENLKLHEQLSAGQNLGGNLKLPPKLNETPPPVQSDPSRVTKNPKSQIIKYARLLHDFPNHLSIHAGGVVISEKPIFYHTALQLMPKGFPISHFDMHHAEDLAFTNSTC